jgi:hypothetical protein
MPFCKATPLTLEGESGIRKIVERVSPRILLQFIDLDRGDDFRSIQSEIIAIQCLFALLFPPLQKFIVHRVRYLGWRAA